MKKLILLLVFSALCCGTTHRVISGEEIDKQLGFYKKLHTLKTSFHQVKKIKSMNLELKSEGKMELSRPEAVVWTIEKPSFSSVQLTGSKISMLTGVGKDRKQQEMTLGKETDPHVSKAILNMMAWMRMDIEEIKKAYKMTETGNQAYRCEPNEPKSAVFASLNFKLHTKGHVEELVIEEKSGDTIQINFDEPRVQFFP